MSLFKHNYAYSWKWWCQIYFFFLLLLVVYLLIKYKCLLLILLWKVALIDFHVKIVPVTMVLPVLEVTKFCNFLPIKLDQVHSYNRPIKGSDIMVWLLLMLAQQLRLMICKWQDKTNDFDWGCNIIPHEDPMEQFQTFSEFTGIGLNLKKRKLSPTRKSTLIIFQILKKQKPLIWGCVNLYHYLHIR